LAANSLTFDVASLVSRSKRVAATLRGTPNAIGVAPNQYDIKHATYTY